jgi:hypothetical protein
MSEKNNHNDPLENIFRKKAEEYDISFKERDWLALEEKLDHHQAIVSYKRRVRWIAAAVLLLISTLGFFTYQNYSKIDQLAQQLNEDSQSENTGNFPADSTSNSVTELDFILPDQLTQQGSKNNTDENSLLNNQQITEAAPPNTNRADETVNAQLNDLPENQSEDLTSVPEPQFLADSIFIAQSTFDITPTRVIDPPSNTLSINSHDAKVPERSVLAFSNNTPRPSSVSRMSANRLELGLLLSPDLSTAGGVSNFQNPGYKFGLSVGYQVTENISLSSGIVQSKVKYTAQSQDYNAPDYGNFVLTPNELFAECIILDIPIGLKYNFRHSDRSRFFSSASLSTYVMLNEDYQFYTPSSSYGPKQQIGTRNVQSGKAHFMSNLGLSIGYEYDLNSSWSLRAEPFLKVPLKNVGWGNVKLYSVGTFVSVNYRL